MNKLPSIQTARVRNNPLDNNKGWLPPIGTKPPENVGQFKNEEINDTYPKDTTVFNSECNCYQGTVIDNDTDKPISFTYENKIESDTYNDFAPIGQHAYRVIYKEYANNNPYSISNSISSLYTWTSAIIFSINILNKLNYNIKEYIEYYYTNLYHSMQRPMIEPKIIMDATDDKIDESIVENIKTTMINNKNNNIKGKYNSMVTNNNLEYHNNKSYILPSKREALPSITRRGGKRKNTRTYKRKNTRTYKRKNTR